MSDPVTNAEVEDVLSSIRRLVSEDKRPMQAAEPKQPNDRLVLTPALRVAEAQEQDVSKKIFLRKDDMIEPVGDQNQSRDAHQADQDDDLWDQEHEPLEVDQEHIEKPPSGPLSSSEESEEETEEDWNESPVSRLEGDDNNDDDVGTDWDVADHDEFALRSSDLMLDKTESNAAEEEDWADVSADSEPQSHFGDQFRSARGIEGRLGTSSDIKSNADMAPLETVEKETAEKTRLDDEQEIEELEKTLLRPEDDLNLEVENRSDELENTEADRLQEITPVEQRDMPMAHSKTSVRGEDRLGDALVGAAALSKKIEALETAIGKIPDAWEPDEAGTDEYSGTQSPSMAWEEEVELDATGSPLGSNDAAKLKDAAQLESEPEIEPLSESAGHDAQDARHQIDNKDDTLQDAVTSSVSGALSLGGDEQLIDEETLRDLVSDIVREELQGALGERITRNVRKLVRREIHRALTAQELE